MITHSGRVIENRISGERIVIRQNAADTDGRLLAFDLFLPPGAHVPAGHAHPGQEELFTLVFGQVRFRLRGRTVTASPGDQVAIPRGAPHWFGNAGPTTAHLRVEVRPALRTEEFFLANEAMSRRGHFLGTRLPRLSDLALVLLEFQPEVSVPNLPAFVVRACLEPLAWLGRRRRRGA
jgi:quercetin dioxygenase-like cupin family protein